MAQRHPSVQLYVRAAPPSGSNIDPAAVPNEPLGPAPCASLHPHILGIYTWVYGGQAHCVIAPSRVEHAARWNNYTGPSLFGFHIWSDDSILCAKAKAYDRAGEPR